MRETAKNFELKPNDKKLVDTAELQYLLCTGRKTAVDIGTAAQACVRAGRRVLWNTAKIQKYLDVIIDVKSSFVNMKSSIAFLKINCLLFVTLCDATLMPFFFHESARKMAKRERQILNRFWCLRKCGE